MPASALISVEEYLSTSYDPDCDYVDGEVLERNVGIQDHSRVQTLLAVFLVPREGAWGYRALAEQRVRIGPTRYRIPDVCIVDRPSREKVITTPPLLCVEVLSPADSMHAMQQKIGDYLGFGVRAVWVINPETRRGWTYTRQSIQEVTDGVLRVPDTPIEVPLAALFDPE